MKYKLLFFAAFALCAIGLMFPIKTSALSSVVPDPGDFSSFSGYTPDVHLEVATRPPTGIGLDAPNSDVLVYMTGLSSIIVTGGNPNCIEDSNTQLDTTFEFSRKDQFGNFVLFKSINALSMNGCGDYTVNLDTYNPANYFQQKYGNRTFMIVRVVAKAISNNVAATNAFKLRLTNPTGNYISYYGNSSSADRFAMQDRNKTTPSPCTSANGGYSCPAANFNLKFGTACYVTQAQTAILKWRDDDAYNSVQPVPISLVLRDVTDVTNVKNVTMYSTTTTGGTLAGSPTGTPITQAKFGSNVSGYAYFTAQPNHKYVMSWNGVDRPNGIQFDLPYESINYVVDCNEPTTAVVTANCTQIRGWTVDGDNTSKALRVIVTIDGATVTDGLASGGSTSSPNPNHWFNTPVGNQYIDGQTHVVHAYVYGINADGSTYAQKMEFPGTVNGGVKVTCTPTVPDICTDVPGIQPPVIPPRVHLANNTCPLPPPTNVYVCLNVPGGPYTTPPAPYVEKNDGTGDCAIPVCQNLGGGPYFSPFAPYVVDPASGNCVIDVCNNLGGIQLSPPFPMTAEPDGRCTDYAECGTMSTSGPLVRGQAFNISVSDLYAGLLTPYRPSDILAVSVNNGVYNNGDVNYGAFSGTLQSSNIQIATGTGTYQTDWVLSGQQIHGTIVCSAQFTVDACSNIPGVQTTDPTGMNLEADGRCTDIPVCGGVTTTGSLEAGIPFTVKVTVLYTGLLTPSRPSDNMSVSFSGGIPGNSNVNFTQTSTSSNSGVLVSDPVPVNAPLGDYTVQWIMSGSDFGSSSPLVCPSAGTSTLKVGKRPYFRVYGGDIRSGGNFAKASKCNVPDSEQGSIIGQYVNGLGGAGTELANIALIRVSGVASADLRTVAPTEPNGLTFANTNLPSGIAINPPDTMGGYYSNTGYCAPDYFNDERFESTDPRLVTDASTSVNISNTTQYPDGQQTLLNNGGRIKIVGNGNISVRHTFFVDGDLDITKDITYPGNVDADPLKNPYLVIIVRGNIFIDPKVKNLTGLFIAQPRYKPDGSTMAGTGRIYTCRDQNGDPAYNDNTKYSSNGSNGCLDKLTVTGGFIAQRILLQRTVNGLSGASIHETADSGNISEVFQETPELYMGRPVFKQKNDKADSIKSLPPIL